MKERKLRSISHRKYNAAIRNNNSDLIFLKARGPNMWQLLYSFVATYLCAKLLQLVDLVSQGSGNMSSGSVLKKITSNFILQNLGKTLSQAFLPFPDSGDSGFNLAPGYKEWKWLYTQSGWTLFIWDLIGEDLNGCHQIQKRWRWMMSGLKDEVFLQRTRRFLMLWCSAMMLHLGGSSSLPVAGQKKWQLVILLEEIKFGCFWLDHVRRTETR